MNKNASYMRLLLLASLQDIEGIWSPNHMTPGIDEAYGHNINIYRSRFPEPLHADYKKLKYGL